MRTIYIWLTVLGLVPWVLRKAARGEFTAEQAASILVAATILAVLPRAIMRFIPVIVGLVMLAREFSQGDPDALWAIFSQLMGLAIMLLGLAIIISGLFPSKRRHCDCD